PEETAETVKPENYDPIYEMVLASAICSPAPGATLPPGKVQVSGYAVPSGEPDEKILSVEVSGDGGATWTAAELSGRDAPYTWKLWRTTLDLAPGTPTLVVRAVDGRGRVQPEKAPWNFKGYLYNGWHRVPITVG